MKKSLLYILFAVVLLGWLDQPASAQTSSKVDLTVRMNITMNNNTVNSVLNAISGKTGIKFVYDVDEMKTLPRVSGRFNDITVDDLLKKCFANTKYKYSIVGNSVIIERTTRLNRLTIYGRITDQNGIPLPGAQVVLKGDYKVGVAADNMGRYRLTFAEIPNMQLVYSFVGYESRTVNVTKSTELNVKLKEDAQSIEDVVVNGIFTRNKNTYTGSVTTIKGEDLLAVSNTNLFTALAALTPGMVIVENNAQGSNPNVIPEILIRGANSIVTSAEEKANNNPLIILDGAEITMEELYDLDMYEIERIDVLKDAQAAIVYGDRAANGVIVVERNRVDDKRVRLNYNFVPSFSIPDLSSLNLCNAEQKLELERLAGLYNDEGGRYDESYRYKLNNVRRGVNTDWTRIPLRIPFSHTHSLSLSGGGQNVDYRASLKFSDTYGVMKGDNRRNYNMNFYVGYHVRNKLTIGYRANYTNTSSEASPYGDFSTYTKMNPYEPIYDENGELIKKYYFYNSEDGPITETGSINNPLYDATLSSFSKSENQTLRNTIDAKWYITKLFYVTGRFGVDISKRQSDAFTSPDAAEYINTTDPLQRGQYSLSTGKGFKYDGNIAVNYSKMLDDKGSGFSVTAVADFEHNNSTTASMVATGFMKDHLNDIKYALTYKANGRPSGSEILSARAGFSGNANFYFRNRYFADISYRTSGSSKYGRNNRWAPMWSYGIGWNINKEKFLSDVKWIDVLKLRWSSGYSGNATFSSYQAMTTYQYSNDMVYYNGVGAVPITMGNENLKWERTMKNNFGLQTTLFNSRFNFSFDYYINTTKDLLMTLSVPASMGVTSVKVNFGKMRNSGYDIALSGTPIRTENFSWITAINASHVNDRLDRISTAMRNESYDLGMGTNIKLRFREGGSQYDLYAMRSAGIDPASGREIYINTKGEYTYVYDEDEEVVVGNTNPTLTGSWLNTFRYKGFTLSLTFMYNFGGDVYNSTLYEKVENIDPVYNVDARAYTDRWKKPGDLARHLALNQTSQENTSERFVERHNELYLSSVNFTYDFSPKALKKIGIKRLQLGFGLSDVVRFSTVKYERGTSYPYCRSINLTIRPTF